MPFGGSNKQQGDLHPQTFQFFHDGLFKFLISWLLRSALMSALLIRYIYTNCRILSLCRTLLLTTGERRRSVFSDKDQQCHGLQASDVWVNEWKSVPFRSLSTSGSQPVSGIPYDHIALSHSAVRAAARAQLRGRCHVALSEAFISRRRPGKEARTGHAN